MRRERVAVGVLLLALLLVFFRDALAPGYALSGADALFTRPFFADVAPPGFAGPSNELLFDAVYQFTPWRRFACDSLRRGELPLWNPDSACGTPLVATMQAAVFYPLNVALCALPVERAAAWGALLRLWIAGFATYLLARRYALGPVAALVAGISFMLCGFLVVWLEHPHTNVAVWLPALVLAVEHVLGASTGRGALRATAALALLAGVQFTGGHIETSVHVLAFLGLYCAVRWWQLRPGSARLALPALAVVLAVGLAAMQLLPFLEWLPLSAELRQRSARLMFDTRTWRHLLMLPLAVFPNLYGNPTWHAPYRSFIGSGNYNEQVLYVGTVPLLLALVALARGPRSAVTRCWALLAIVAAGMTFWIPPLAWLNRLPGLSLAHPERLRLILSFALCVLAGCGTAALVDDADGRRIRLLGRLAAAVVAAGVLLAIVANTVLPRTRERLVAFGREVAARRYAELTYHAQPLDRYLGEVDRLARHVVDAFALRNVGMYAPALWAGALLVALRARRGRELAVVALAAADLVTVGQGYHPALPRAQLYPPTALTRRLSEDRELSRFTALGEALIPDTHMMYGLSDVRGLDFRTAWYDDYLGLLPDRITWIDYGVILASTTSPLLRVLNLAYVAGDVQTLRGPEGLAVVAESPSIALGRVAQVQPRSYLVYDAPAVPSDAEALVRLRAAPAAVFRRAVLVAPPGTAAPPALPPRGDLPGGDVTLLDYGARAASWRVRTPRAGYLVTTDAWYPGWQAALDGRDVPVYRANGAFRAVYVDAGEHVVAYRFVPRSVQVGLAVSAATALVLGGILALTRRSRAP